MDFNDELVELLPRLRRFAAGLAGNLQDADDLVQAACERALSRQHQWQAGTRLDSWMYRIIQNLWIDRNRSSRSRSEHVDMDEVSSLADQQAHRVAEIDSTLARVAEAIGRLPDEQRDVLMLVGVGEYSYREAAEELGIPVGTVMSRLARARLRLTRLVDGPADATDDGV
jgi:RNA polymerase sigma-70 factor (ECF subfamily)